MLQSFAMKITLQTLHSNPPCDPLKPLPPLELEPIATLSQWLPNLYTLLQPMQQLRPRLLDSHQGHHETPMQWMSTQLINGLIIHVQLWSLIEHELGFRLKVM